jgi:SAM-dependent methyltransferase
MRDLYEARAAQQYAAPSPLPDPRVDRKFARICAAVRERLPCEAFLDAGCGDGRYLAALDAELPERIAGVDIAERIVETARARVTRADLRQANLESLPFDDGAFDLVLSSQVIEHVLDGPAAVRELARVLRPGGQLVISTDNADNRITRALNAPRNAIVRLLGLRGRRGQIESPATPYTRTSFRALLADGGFEIEHVETFRFHLMWPLDQAPLTRMLNALDERLGDRGLGDILLAVARKP